MDAHFVHHAAGNLMFGGEQPAAVQKWDSSVARVLVFRLLTPGFNSTQLGMAPKVK